MVSRHVSAVASGLSIVAFAVLAAGCDVTFGVEQYTEREERRFAVTGTANVDLSTFDGSIEVRGWDQAEVLVQIEKRGRDKAATERMKVNFRQDGNTIFVDVPKPTGGVEVGGVGWNSSPSARIIASVPRTSNLVTRSGDGSVSVERVSGRVDLHTEDGSVRIDEVTGTLLVRTGDGSVRARAVDGRADIRTEDGSVVLDGTLRAVSLETGDGSARLAARTGSGMDADWQVTTGSGSIEVEIPSGFDADLDAHTGDGHVNAEHVDTSGGTSGKRTVKGRIGSGGRTLRLRSGDGTIYVR